MKRVSLRRLASPVQSPDVWLLLLLLAAATPAIFFRHQTLFLVPHLDLLDDSWLLDTSYKAARGIWFGRDVAFTYGPLFQWLSSAPAPWLGLSMGAIFAAWFTLPLLVIIVATFLSGRLLFSRDQGWRRTLFLLLAVVFWSVPDVRASISLLAFLIFLRLADAVASGAPSPMLAAIAAAGICIGCFVLSADTGIYCAAALLLTVGATAAIMWRAPRALLRLVGFLILAVICFALLILATNALMMTSPLNFSFWRTSLAIATSYRWFEALGMPNSSKHLLLLTLACGIAVFLLAWKWRSPYSRHWTLRPAFLLSGFCFALVMMQSGLVRSDPGHVMLAIFPMVFLCGAILIGGRKSSLLISTVSIAAAVVLTLVFAHAYWLFRPYSLKVKADEIAHPILACADGYHSFDHACLLNHDADLLSQVSSYVDRSTTAADPIVVFPYETAFGLTSRRTVAGGVLQSYLVNGPYLTNVELAGLRRANPPFGLYFPDGIISQGVDGIPNFTRSPELWFYLLRHYRSADSQLNGFPSNGVVGLVRDDSRDWRMRFSSQPVAKVAGELPVRSRNAWLDLGTVNPSANDIDFLRIRLRVNYSPLWKIRKPSHLSLQITYADGSQKLLAFLVEPNLTTDVWIFPWDERTMGSYFAAEESQWRSSSRPVITGLKLFITRYDWVSVVPSSVFIEEIAGVRVRLSSPAEQVSPEED